jgi:hypothetical protein
MKLKNCHTNLAERLLTPNLERHPGKTAYLCNDEAVSYQQLVDGVHRWSWSGGIGSGGQGVKGRSVALARPLFGFCETQKRLRFSCSQTKYPKWVDGQIW